MSKQISRIVLALGVSAQLAYLSYTYGYYFAWKDGAVNVYEARRVHVECEIMAIQHLKEGKESAALRLLESNAIVSLAAMGVIASTLEEAGLDAFLLQPSGIVVSSEGISVSHVDSLRDLLTEPRRHEPLCGYPGKDDV